MKIWSKDTQIKLESQKPITPSSWDVMLGLCCAAPGTSSRLLSERFGFGVSNDRHSGSLALRATERVLRRCANSQSEERSGTLLACRTHRTAERGSLDFGVGGEPAQDVAGEPAIDLFGRTSFGTLGLSEEAWSEEQHIAVAGSCETFLGEALRPGKMSQRV